MTLQASRSYHNKKKINEAMKTYICIAAKKSPSSRLPYKSFSLKTTQNSKYFNE